MYETMMAGPAWLAAAVPVSTKIPVPMIPPMPSRVRSHADRLRRSARSPCSTSLTSCSIDLVLKRCESIGVVGYYAGATPLDWTRLPSDLSQGGPYVLDQPVHLLRVR